MTVCVRDVLYEDQGTMAIRVGIWAYRPIKRAAEESNLNIANCIVTGLPFHYSGQRSQKRHWEHTP